jgi:hypothetical protein
VCAVPDVDEPPPLDEEIASLTTEDLKKRILAEAGRKLSVAAIAKRYRLSTDYVSLIIKFSKSIREGE